MVSIPKVSIKVLIIVLSIRYQPAPVAKPLAKPLVQQAESPAKPPAAQVRDLVAQLSDWLPERYINVTWLWEPSGSLRFGVPTNPDL